MKHLNESLFENFLKITLLNSSMNGKLRQCRKNDLLVNSVTRLCCLNAIDQNKSFVLSITKNDVFLLWGRKMLPTSKCSFFLFFSLRSCEDS